MHLLQFSFSKYNVSLNSIVYLKKDNNDHETEPREKESADEVEDGHQEDGRCGGQDDEEDDHEDTNRLKVLTTN